MLQAFIITLREGVEAALIVGITLAYLAKIGRNDLRKSVYAALATAFAGSIAVAVVLSRLNLNQDIFEGWVMLVAAVFVVTMIVFMMRTSRKLKGDIENKVGLFARGDAWIGLFLFVFLMVLREGVETVLILSAVTLNSNELMSFIGTVLGVVVAVLFGVMFVKGSVKINLQKFFRVTTAILFLVAAQLLISGLHELSENGVLPSSRQEMAIIGPIVRNDLFFFVTMLALAGLMMLMEYRRRAPVALSATATAADRRRAEWSQRREKMWMTAVVATSFVFIFLSTAEFIYAKSSTALSPTAAVTLVGSQVTLPAADVNDDQLHRYGVHLDDGKGGNVEIRFLLFKKPDGTIVSVADACQICGPVGFYIGAQGITCKMCASPLNAASMGQKGGCNPIPLKSTVGGGQVVIQAADLRELAPVFER